MSKAEQQYAERIKELERRVEELETQRNSAWREVDQLKREVKIYEDMRWTIHEILTKVLGIESYNTTTNAVEGGLMLKFNTGYLKALKTSYGVELTINVKRTGNPFLDDLILHELQTTIDELYIKQMKEKGYTTERRKVYPHQEVITVQTNPNDLICDWEKTQAALKTAYNRYRLIVEGKTP